MGRKVTMLREDPDSDQDSWKNYFLVGFGILIIVIIVIVLIQNMSSVIKFRPVFMLGPNCELKIKDVAPSNPPTGFTFFGSHDWCITSVLDHSIITRTTNDNDKATTQENSDVLISDIDFPNTTGKFLYSVTMTYQSVNGVETNAVGVCTSNYIYRNI